MTTDPYSSPTADSFPPQYSSGAAVTQGVIQQLAGTKPWVRLMSVLMFIGAGFMLLGALAMGVAGGFGAFNVKGGPTLFAGFPVVIALVYAALSILYIFPALKLWKYADWIARLMATASTMDLEQALSQQRSFWKFIGICIIAMFVLYLVIIILMVALGGFAAMSASKGMH
jgi:hypothetical protein